MLVSIVAASYNNEVDTLDFIRSIRYLNFPAKDLETILIDNGSQKNIAYRVKKLYPKAKIIKLKKNYGAPYALNIGFKKAKGKYIFKCDTDVILEKNCLKHLFEYIKNHKNVGIVGPRNYYKDKPDIVSPSAQKFNFWLGSLSTYKNLDKEQKPGYIQGCAMLFKKEIINKIGYLDDKFIPYLFDDQDFCLRASREKINIIYFPKATIWHSTTQKAQSRPKLKLEAWYKNKVRFIIKNASLTQIVSSLTLQLLSTPIYLIFYRDGTANAIFKSFIWNFKNINKTLTARKQQKYEPTFS